jgi:hypothetical protein
MEVVLLSKRIDDLSKDFSLSKYNFLKISYLVRLVEDSSQYSTHCENCKANQKLLEKMVEELPFLDDIEHREAYEKKFNHMRMHFHREHGYVAPYHFTSRYVVAGIIFGAAIASLLSFLAKGAVMLDPILAGITIGLMAGYFWGSYTEKKYRNSKKII